MTSNPAIPAWRCPPKLILAAVDFEAASARAVALAGFIASACDASLHVLHAERADVPPYFTLAQMARLEDERAAAAAEVLGELKRFAVDATAWPVRAAVTDQGPVDAILEVASAADLLVLGTHGRRGPSRWWLGSVAERVVRASPVPVLVTRASATPLADVFSRVVLVADGAEPPDDARACVQGLVTAIGGQVIDAVALDRCRSDVMMNASLVAVAGASTRSPWSISDAVAETLGRCGHPALFLPSR